MKVHRGPRVRLDGEDGFDTIDANLKELGFGK